MVVASLVIHLCEVLGLSRPAKKIFNEQDRILVPNSYLIELPVVDVSMLESFFLFLEQNHYIIRWLTMTHVTVLEEIPQHLS